MSCTINQAHIQRTDSVCEFCERERMIRIEAKLDLLLAKSEPKTDYSALEEQERMRQPGQQQYIPR